MLDGVLRPTGGGRVRDSSTNRLCRHVINHCRSILQISGQQAATSARSRSSAQRRRVLPPSRRVDDSGRATCWIQRGGDPPSRHSPLSSSLPSSLGSCSPQIQLWAWGSAVISSPAASAAIARPQKQYFLHFYATAMHFFSFVQCVCLESPPNWQRQMDAVQELSNIPKLAKLV